MGSPAGAPHLIQGAGELGEVAGHRRAQNIAVHLAAPALNQSARRRSSMRRPSEIAEFLRVVHTIGGYIVFPSNRIDGRPTINMSRGTNRQIHDRFDLTLECIRRYYRDDPSPLTEVVSRYSHFFRLFGDFDGYVDFFLLQDLIDENGRVEFFLPFNDFPTLTFPRSVADYEIYRERASEFVIKRNRRIQALFGSTSPA